MTDWHSRKMLWLKWSNDNKAENACDLLLKSARENISPLKVSGKMGVENRLLAKHIILLRDSVNNGWIGRRYIQNDRIECFGVSVTQLLKIIFRAI